MKHEIDPVVDGELKRLLGKTVRVFMPTLGMHPAGVLKDYNPETGQIVLERVNDSPLKPTSTMSLDAARITAVANYI